MKLSWECIRDLVDHPLNREQEDKIHTLLARGGIQPEEVADLRTRRWAEQIFADLTLRT